MPCFGHQLQELAMSRVGMFSPAYTHVRVMWVALGYTINASQIPAPWYWSYSNHL